MYAFNAHTLTLATTRFDPISLYTTGIVVHRGKSPAGVEILQCFRQRRRALIEGHETSPHSQRFTAGQWRICPNRMVRRSGSSPQGHLRVDVLEAAKTPIPVNGERGESRHPERTRRIGQDHPGHGSNLPTRRRHRSHQLRRRGPRPRHEHHHHGSHVNPAFRVDGRSEDCVSQYSLGMKQRPGITAALSCTSRSSEET